MQVEAQVLHVVREDKVEHLLDQDHLDQELQEQSILVVVEVVDIIQEVLMVLEQQVVQEL